MHKVVAGARTLDEWVAVLVSGHQTDVTGFTPFVNGEVVEESNGTGNASITNPRIDGEVLPYSGELLYLNNRGAIERSANQSEDIKIILQL